MDVVIPQKINNVQVKSIGWAAFTYDCSDVVLPISTNNKYEIKPVNCRVYPIGITSIKLPDGLETIGRDAFAGNKLKTVTIPASVTTIDHGAFYDNELQSVIFKGNKNNIRAGCATFNGEKHSASVNALTMPVC